MKIVGRDISRIAERAGISIAAVYRALGGKVLPHRLTRTSLEGALRDLGFGKEAIRLKKEWEKKK